MKKHNHHNCQTKALQQAEDVCAEHGLKFTKHRQAVFEIIWQSHRALTASEIMEKLGNSQPPITYRALDFLTEHQLIHKVTTLNAYIGCTHLDTEGHTGQMLICTECHTVKEMDSGTLTHLVNEAKAEGFVPSQTHVEMLGVCQNCTASRL